jgi:predicted O-methyltransferase YrrM
MAGDLFIPEELYQYLLANSLRETPVMRKLREETSRREDARYEVPPEHAQFMALLVQLMRAERTIEIGVYTGYSALAVALALPAHGRIVACDINEEFTAIARRYWKEAGVEQKIDLRIKPALETLKELLAAGEAGRFDFAFIDANKTGYDDYYEACLELIRPGGLIFVDNVLWSGRVCDASDQTDDTVALRAFSAKRFADSRVVLSMLPVGDGITLALKR